MPSNKAGRPNKVTNNVIDLKLSSLGMTFIDARITSRTNATGKNAIKKMLALRIANEPFIAV